MFTVREIWLWRSGIRHAERSGTGYHIPTPAIPAFGIIARPKGSKVGQSRMHPARACTAPAGLSSVVTWVIGRAKNRASQAAFAPRNSCAAHGCIGQDPCRAC